MITLKATGHIGLYEQTLTVEPSKVYSGGTAYDGYVEGLRLTTYDEDTLQDIVLTDEQVRELVTYMQSWLTARDQT